LLSYNLGESVTASWTATGYEAIPRLKVLYNLRPYELEIAVTIPAPTADYSYGFHAATMLAAGLDIAFYRNYVNSILSPSSLQR